MKRFLIVGLLLAASVAHADGLGLSLTPQLQVQQYPLSFCGQYPDADVCKQKPEHHDRTKCIDGTLYHEVERDGDHYWVQSHNSDGTLIMCHEYKE